MGRKLIRLVALIAIFIAIIFSTTNETPRNKITGFAIITPEGSFNISDFPPVIEADDYIGNASDLVIINFNIYDPNGNPVNYNFTSPLNDSGQWQSAANDSGIYYSIITAYDGTLQSTKTVVIKLRPYCGDGTVDSGESCDDGNNISGDGCSST